MEDGLRSISAAALRPKQKAKSVSERMGGDQFDWERKIPPKEVENLLIH
jgi:hypothetical protein